MPAELEAHLFNIVRRNSAKFENTSDEPVYEWVHKVAVRLAPTCEAFSSVNRKECLQCGVYYTKETSECEFCGGNPTITKSKQKRDKKKAAAERKKEESVQKVVRIRRAYLQPGTEEFEGRQIKPIDYFHQIEAVGFY